MHVLWFSWKDIKHPLSGGAETVSHQLMTRLVQDGHEVTLITSLYPGAKQFETLDGIQIYRTGGRTSVYIKAWRLFRNQLKDWPDLVVDEMNTVPFASAFYTKKRSILLTYQLAREVWFYQMFFPLSLLGYLLEPIYLYILSKTYKTIITESESTRQDLQRYGFSNDNIHVVRVGIKTKPIPKLKPKKLTNTILVLGSIRPMKQTLDAVKAFEYARDLNPKLRLVIAGDDNGRYASKVKDYATLSRHGSAISILGRVSGKKRESLMRESSMILVTSVKEGWGLIVTEANSQGTVAIAYDSDGLRDSVINGKTGVLVQPGDTKAMGNEINQLFKDAKTAENFRINAFEYSKRFTFEKSYDDFKQALGITK